MTILYFYLLQKLQAIYLWIIILPQEFHIPSMSWLLILPLKIPLCIMFFALCMSALEHFTVLPSVYTFQFWVSCLHCTLTAQFNLQEKPVCWHYTQLSTYLGSITVNCRIYKLKQNSSLYGWKVKLTLCLTSTTWLRCSWGKAPHTLNLSAGGECSSSCIPGKCIPYQLDRRPCRLQRWSWYISEKEIFALAGHDSQAM